MKVQFVKDTFSNKDNTKTFYVVRYVLTDDKGNVVRKGEPVLWLNKEQYDLVKF